MSATAARPDLCWNVFCTTCGAQDVRGGIQAASLGVDFGGLADSRGDQDEKRESWRQICRAALRGSAYGFRRPVPIAMRRAIILLARSADLKAMSAETGFPTWLGHLGVVLHFYAMEDRALLSASWIPQFIELGGNAEVWALYEAGGPAAFDLTALEYAETERLGENRRRSTTPPRV